MLGMIIPTREIRSSPFAERNRPDSSIWQMIAKTAEAPGANLFVCKPDIHYAGLKLAGECVLAVTLVILMGVLAGVSMAVMDADLTRLLVWTRTGGQKQRKQAAMTLEVRSRPNWLLTSLILASVMVAEGLPLILNHLLPSNVMWAPFLISSTAVILFAEIIPHAIVPYYFLEVSGRSIWFVKLIMYLMAIPACLLAYAMKQIRHWQNRQEPKKLEGILETDELIEFVGLHTQGEHLGGQVTNRAGTIVKTIIEHQYAVVGESIRPWNSAILLEATSPIKRSTLKRLTASTDHYAILTLSGRKESGQILQENRCDHEEKRHENVNTSINLAGVVFVKDLVNLDTDPSSIVLSSIPIHPVAVVQANCSVQELLSLLTYKNYPCAFVVSPLENSPSNDIIDITPHLSNGGPLKSETLLPLGFVDYRDLVSRVLFGHEIPDISLAKDDNRCLSDMLASQILEEANMQDLGKRNPNQRQKRACDNKGPENAPIQLRSASLGTVTVSPKFVGGERFHASTSGYSPRPRPSIYSRFGVNRVNRQGS